MTRVVVIAVFFLAVIATVDTLRPRASERGGVSATGKLSGGPVVHPVSSSGFSAAGGAVRTQVLFHGRPYLSAEEIRRAFPRRLDGAVFSIAYLAADGDGTVVLAIFAFPQGGTPIDGIEIWRRRRLESSFLVPLGAAGGGLGFAAEGRLIATLSGDGLLVHLFDRDGRPRGRQPATSW